LTSDWTALSAATMLRCSRACCSATVL
jgi:hypothetical protein